MVNTVVVRFILMREEPPMTAIFTEYKAVFTMIPASRLSTPSFVCKMAVTNPRRNTCCHSCHYGQKRMSAYSYYGSYSGSKSKAAICRKVADIQHRITKKQSKNCQGTDQSKLQSSLPEGEHSCNRHSDFLQLDLFHNCSTR